MNQRRRRRTGNYRGGRKAFRPITIYLQRIPRDKFDALTEPERYALLLLGHVHDEISWFQRMAFVASKQGGHGSDLEGSANMMQATFLMRMLLGKLFEFKQCLGPETSPLSTFIIENWRPHDIAAGKAQRKALVDEFDAEGWLRIARNKHFLHYPTLGDMEDTLRDPDIHWHVEIAHGKKSSNTFYPASDVFANYAWFRRVNGSEPMKGLREALDVLRRVAGLTLATLEQSIGYFVDRKLVSLGENELVS